MNEQLINAYKKARQEVIKAIDEFPSDKREEKLFDDWKLREVIIHLTGWDNYLANGIKSLKEGREPSHYGKVDDFNKNSINNGRNLGWEGAYKEFIKAGERVIKEYESLADNLWNAYFWKTKKLTPAKFLKTLTEHYEEEHLPAIKKIIH